MKKRAAVIFLLMVTILSVSMYSAWQTLTSRPSSYIKANVFETKNDVARSTSTPNTCVAKKRIFYLKVHKTGSTTVSIIAKRFGINNNVNFIMPANRRRNFGVDNLDTIRDFKFDQYDITRPKETPDLLFLHTIYNRSLYESILPVDMVRVSSVREPVAWFLSFFYYDHYDYIVEEQYTEHHTKIKKYDAEFYIRKYLSNIALYNRKPTAGIYRLTSDFGIPKDKVNDVNFIRRYIHDVLDKDFQLVMIAEYFDESLILLKRIMCWSTRDILYISRNTYNDRERRRPQNLSKDIVNEIHDKNAAVFLIYEHFLAVYKQRVASQDAGFWDEVEEFKSIQKTAQDWCLFNTSSVQLSQFRGLYKIPSMSEESRFVELSSKFSGNFRLTARDCEIMLLDLQDWPTDFPRPASVQTTH